MIPVMDTNFEIRNFDSIRIDSIRFDAIRFESKTAMVLYGFKADRAGGAPTR